jgi:hypothetical protein
MITVLTQQAFQRLAGAYRPQRLLIAQYAQYAGIHGS